MVQSGYRFLGGYHSGRLASESRGTKQREGRYSGHQMQWIPEDAGYKSIEDDEVSSHRGYQGSCLYRERAPCVDSQQKHTWILV